MEKQFGWTNKILSVNLGSGTFEAIPTMPYAERFVGGRGVASRLYWERMDDGKGAFDAESRLYFMSGPLAGTGAPGASRWVVVGKSPMAVPEQYASANLGGKFGEALKRAGLDGLELYGSSPKPVILVLGPDGESRIEDGLDLWGRDVDQTVGALEARFGKGTCAATIGRPGELRVRFATISGSHGMCATKGFGAVMGSKNLKAVVVKPCAGRQPPARPEEFRKTLEEAKALWHGEGSERYWNELMIEGVEKVQNVACAACPGICRRGVYRSAAGERGFRKTCVSAFYYSNQEKAKTGRMADATFHATQVANQHGLCILELRFLAEWLPEAFRRGAAEAPPGLQPGELGTSAWVDALVELIVERRGLGDLLAEGSRRSASGLGVEDLLDGMVTGAGFDADYYSPRLFISNAPIYATEPVYPIAQLHRVSFPMVKWMVRMGTEGMMGAVTTEKLRNLAEAFWGDARAAEFDTAEKKGAAAVINQDRCYAMENMVYCDWFWPIDFTANTETGAGDPALEARLFSSVTGLDMDAGEYLRTGSRCANLCRAIYLREGRRGRVDDVLEDFNFKEPLEYQDPPVGLFNPDYLLPGRGGKLFSRRGKAVDRDMFQTIMDDYYDERGWDRETGLPTRAGLAGLGLDDIAAVLDKRGLLVQNK